MTKKNKRIQRKDRRHKINKIERERKVVGKKTKLLNK